MNKIYLILVLILVFGKTAKSQDLIVTKSNDSILCKIIKLKKENIYFVFKNESEFQSTLMPLSEVNSYLQDFYTENPIPKEKLPGFVNNSKIRISVSGGYSYDPSKLDNSIPSGFKPYFNALRSGYNMEGSFIYYLDKTIGFGIKYNFMRATNSSNNAVFGQGGNQFTGILSDKISVSFIGAVSSIRFLGKNNKTAFLLNSAFGYLLYSNDQTVFLDTFHITGNAFGVVSEVGYDFEISKNLYLGFQLGLTAGKVNKVESDNGSVIEVIELENNTRMQGSGRIDTAIGLRYVL